MSHILDIGEIRISQIENIRHWDIQAHLGLELELDSMAHTALRPRPQATLKPIGKMIFISTYHAMSPISRSVNHFPSKKTIARGVPSLGCTVVPQGVLLLSNSTELGTSSKATHTTPHSHLHTLSRLTTSDHPCQQRWK